MPDSSYSSPVSFPDFSENPGLPQRVSLDMTVADFVQIFDTAVRYAGDMVGADTIDVQITPEKRMWWFRQLNIKTHIDTCEDEDEFTGTLTLPVYLFKALADTRLEEDQDYVTLDIDFKDQLISYKMDGCTFTVPLPPQKPSCITDILAPSRRIIVQMSDLFQVAPFLSQIPVYLPDELDESMHSEFPFIQFSYDGTDLRISRDWGRFGGPKISMTIPAGGDYRGSFSVYAEILPREFNTLDAAESGAFTFEFSDHHPNLCHMTTGSFGMVVELGLEHVFQHRSAITMSLDFAHPDLEVVEEKRRSWNPVIEINAGTRLVTATITPMDHHQKSYLRLDTEIISDVVWTPELAAEINAWNDKWPTVKVVYVNNAVRDIADVPEAAYTGTAEYVSELVEKAQIVHELIGAVL